MDLKRQIEADMKYRKTVFLKSYSDVVCYIIGFILCLIYLSTGMFLTQMILTSMIFIFYANPFLVVQEGGKSHYYTEKFKFVPIDKSIFYKSKKIIIINFGIKIWVLFQTIHVIGMIMFKIPMLSFEILVPTITVGSAVLLILLQLKRSINKL